MNFTHRNSLALTLDAINEAFFYKRSLSKSTVSEATQWIASRQGMTGSYAGMFAPTKKNRISRRRRILAERILEKC